VYPTEGVFFHFTAKVRGVSIFCFFESIVTSLKEREFTYTKFQHVINSTTHHILDLGGSSIP
jgi:hypothetical protein